jgi:hypothetical protein
MSVSLLFPSLFHYESSDGIAGLQEPTWGEGLVLAYAEIGQKTDFSAGYRNGECSGMRVGEVVPGKSVGRIVLGMSRTEAIRLLGKPTRAQAVKRRNEKTLKVSKTDLYTEVWEYPRAPGTDDPTHLTVVSRAGKIIQINYSSPRYATPEGITPASSFTDIRKAYPKMTVREYVFLGFEPQAAGAYAAFLMDDTRRGIAFLTGTQDDVGTYMELPKITPQTIYIHAPGQPALPVEEDEWAAAPVNGGSDYLTKIRDWFAGGPHRPPKNP